MMMKRNLRPAARRGAGLVELAIALPLLLAFFGIMVEVSRIMMLQHTADTAAYEGARAGLVPGATSLEAREAARQLISAAKVEHFGLQVTPDTITETTPVISVSVEIPFAENSWIIPQWFPVRSVRSDVTLFCERPPMVQLTGVPALKSKKLNMGGPKTGL